MFDRVLNTPLHSNGISRSKVTFIDEQITRHKQAGNALWSSEEHIQSWIDKLNENSVTSEETEPFGKKDSFDADVFLRLPGCTGQEVDDLALGAEARHYGNCCIISPRLSPASSFERLNDGSFFQESDKGESLVPSSPGLSASDIKAVNEEKNLFDPLLFKEPPSDSELEEEKPPSKPPLWQMPSEDSFDSYPSIDKPASLAAAMRTDPEELLYNLGFVSNESSLLHMIPSRFFQQPSDAFGINVEEIHMSLLAQEDEQYYGESLNDFEMNPINHPRFSQNSIDNSSVMSASSKRLLFQSHHNDMPCIYVSQEDSDCPNTPSTTTSGSMFGKRLETLEEVPEPNSRSSSFDNERSNISITEALSNVAGQLYGFMKRQCSDTTSSRKDALINEIEVENKTQNIVPTNTPVDDKGREVDVNSNLLDKNMNITYSRVSSKSSISTIVDLSKLDEGVKFKPIESNEPPFIRDYTRENTKASLTANDRRTLFKQQKSEAIQDSNEVFVSEDVSNSEMNLESERQNIWKDETNDTDSILLTTFSHDPSQKRRDSLKRSFASFFKKIGKHSMDKGNRNIEIQIILTPPDQKQSESICLKWDDHGNELMETASKNSILESFVSSLSNLVGKSHEEKNSTCDDEVAKINKSATKKINQPLNSDIENSPDNATNDDNTDDKSSERDPEYNNVKSTKRTAFQDVAGNESESLPQSFSEKKASSKFLSLFSRKRSNLTNSKSMPTGLNEIVNINENKNENKDTVSEDNRKLNGINSYCLPQQTSKSGGTENVIKAYSDIDIEPVKNKIRCPLGKNCSIDHSRNNTSSNAREKHGNSNALRSRENSSDVSSIFLTHEHFDYMVKEFSDIKESLKRINFRQTLQYKDVLAERQNEQTLGEKERLQQLQSTLEKQHTECYQALQEEIRILRRDLEARDAEIARLKNLLHWTGENR